MPIIKTLKNGQWTPVNSVTSLGTATPSTAGLMSAEDKANLNGLANYSTEEQVIGTWVNGKPLYKKTVDFGAFPNNTTKSVPHGISNISKIVKITAIASASNIFLSVPWASPDNAIYNPYLYADLTNINLRTARDMTNYTECYVTLEYTKTTD